MSEKQDVLVLLESDDGKLSLDGSALLSEGARLARQLQGKLKAVLLGTPASSFGEEASRYGVSELFYTGGDIESYNPLLLQGIVSKKIEELKPGFLLALVSSTGNDLMPGLAFKHGAPLIANCADILFGEDRSVHFLQPVQGGRLFAEISTPLDGLKMAIMQPQRLSVKEVDGSDNVQFTRISADGAVKNQAVRNTGFKIADHRTIDITEAQVIVAVGRGLGTKAELPLAENLADALGGAMGCTRPMVDAGIFPYERQIGQTGKKITPRFNVLCGISGAIEFTQGIQGDSINVAINIDPRAPIFNKADLGIIGDCREVLPQLLKCVAEKCGTGNDQATAQKGGNAK